MLYDFTASSDGCAVAGGVVFDKSGNLFGTTTGCGAFGLGNVFELSPNSSGGWTESVLYSFNGCCPNNPSGPLIVDSAGNLYGTGPNPDDGYIYQLAKGSDGRWTENIIYAFPDIQHGEGPAGGLIADKNGNLYGTTAHGGAQFGNGWPCLQVDASFEWHVERNHSLRICGRPRCYGSDRRRDLWQGRRRLRYNPLWRLSRRRCGFQNNAIADLSPAARALQGYLPPNKLGERD